MRLLSNRTGPLLEQKSALGPLSVGSRGWRFSKVYCNVTLYPAKQQQNNHNDKDQAQPATGKVAP